MHYHNIFSILYELVRSWFIQEYLNTIYVYNQRYCTQQQQQQHKHVRNI